MNTERPEPFRPSPELRRLVDSAIAGDLDRTGMVQLEQYLESNPSAMQWYLEMAEIEALLPLAAEKAPGVNPIRSRSRWSWRSIAAMTGAAAAVVTLLIARPWASRETISAGPIARITASISPRWSDGRRAPNLSAPLGQQTLALETGLVEITYANGAVVLIEGPARYTIDGANSGRLDFGRLVASIPPGAQGFTIETATEKIVDHGTEFAIDAPKGGRPEVGVFRGEIELTSLDGQRSIAKLFTDHAVTHEPSGQDAVTSIPFDRSKFIRTLPSREFKWEFKDVLSNEQHTFKFDVTGLIWGGGDYRVIFKWMDGRDALDIENVSLFRNDQRIAHDTHRGATGVLRHVKDNSYRLTLPEELPAVENARWTLEVTCRPWIPKSEQVRFADSRGILLFESGLALSATESDFVGRWEYSHSGSLYVREFKSDGTATLTINGAPWAGFDGSRWSCRDGVLHLDLASGVTENHTLRDSATLLFVNTPYRNARRLPAGG
jgi:hypothetical protein